MILSPRISPATAVTWMTQHPAGLIGGCSDRDLKWIRTLYAYPTVSRRLIDLFKTEPKLCNYLDIPIQHISDNVLQRMKRRSSEEQIRTLIARLRSEIPGITLRTSLIVGFPGETVDDFLNLTQFVEKAQFDRLGVFCSPGGKDTAAEMPDQVSTGQAGTPRKLMKTQARYRSGVPGHGLTDCTGDCGGHSEETELLLRGTHQPSGA